jgi:hypothetical protein
MPGIVDYLTGVASASRAEMKASPAEWMPWNYREALA